jgi:hypothetical protein
MSWAPLHQRSAARAAAVVAAALILGVAGCGDDSAGERDVKPLGELLAGSVAPLAQCKHWVGGSRERKLATIEDIRAQVSRRDTGIRAPALSDEEALGLFDRACANSYAQSFRLYVLYARAAGFAPLTRDVPAP